MKLKTLGRSILRVSCIVLLSLAVIQVFGALTGCASPKWQQANRLHGELLGKFTYIKQGEDDKEVGKWTGYEEEFSGDCDDYYIAVHNRFKALGWTTIGVYAQHKLTREKHVLACTYGDSERLICLDNESDLVRKWGQVKAHYHIIRHWMETR